MKYTLYILLFFSFSATYAQYDHEDVFSEKEGEELRQLVIDNYKPNVVLSYSQARDTMYGVIDNVNDSVAGIYTNHRVYLKPGEDPSTYLYKDGQVNGINAEHSYPQSKGAGNGNARSDMHHLFPSRIGTNSARGSLPFSEINDASTQTWYYLNQENSSTPSASTIDLYSERGNEKWEPRESVKGDIARAIMYFYTMYKQQADNADGSFFNIQKETLCDWHYLDPVSEKEWNRTKMIAQRQEGKSNPFVLDCSLASRIYCSEISDVCLTVDVKDITTEVPIFLTRNPVREQIVFSWKGKTPFGAFAQKSKLSYQLISVYSSQVLLKGDIDSNTLVGQEIVVPLDNIPAGAYIVQWIVYDSKSNQSQIIPFKIIKVD